MRRLLLLLALLLPGAPVAAEPAPHPELVSFADMVRLSSAAPPAGEPAAAQAPLRVTAAPPAAPEPRLVVRNASPVERWLLLLSGLAAAGWVAHRRLVSPL